MPLFGTLKKQPPVIRTGEVTINFGTAALWRDFTFPIDTDYYASAYKYLELWMGEVKDRYPAVQINLVVDRSDKIPEVDAAGASHGEEILETISRLALDLHNRPQDWIVQRNTEESKFYWERYKEGEKIAKGEADAGPEAGDPA